MHLIQLNSPIPPLILPLAVMFPLFVVVMLPAEVMLPAAVIVPVDVIVPPVTVPFVVVMFPDVVV